MPPRRPPGAAPGSGVTPLPPDLSPDDRRRNYQTVADPRLPDGKGKEMARRYETTPRMRAKDPRRPGTRPHTSKRKARKTVERVTYKWDAYSVGTPPARELVLTGLSPRTPLQVVLQQCRVFGAIGASELKVDPQTGESIGIMWVQYAPTTASGAAQDAAEAAQIAQRKLDGQRIGQEVVRVALDRERAHYVRAYRALLGQRYSGARRRVAPRVSDASAPASPAVRGARARDDERIDSPHRATTSSAVYATARPQLARQAQTTATPIRARLAALGHAYLFLPLPHASLDAAAVRAHFASFAPALVERDHAGWYVGFAEADAAVRCKRVLEPTTLQGYRVRLDVLPAPEARGEAAAPALRPALKAAPAAAPAAEAPRAAPRPAVWTRAALLEEAERQLLAALEQMFVRDVKNRVLAPRLTACLAPEGPGAQFLAAHKTHTAAKPAVAPPPVLDTHLPSFRKRPDVVAAQRAKPARADDAADAARATPLDPVALGVAADGEELYYLQRVLAQGVATDVGAAREDVHASGCARAEGFYRIPAAEKAAHLPDRNRAAEAPAAERPALGSARNNRADSRRLVLDMEQHKRETLTDTDMLKFNQLQTRKKQLRFSKSPIHDWGLYAMELIPAGDMVIEYVGEIVRQQVADHREKLYERAGNFSTYLFRVDDDVVVDATHKGNIARLMNVRAPLTHSTVARRTARPRSSRCRARSALRCCTSRR